MKKPTYWSIRYKLLFLLLLLSVTTFVVTGTIAYIKYRTALKQDVTNKLTGATRAKRSQIESYYQTVHSHVETLSDDHMFIDAMREFQTAYRKLNKKPVPAKTLEAVRDDYRDNFYTEMQKLGIARKSFRAYLPVTPAAIQLQYLYIVKNPYPKGQRYKLVNAGDGSDYSKVHEKYQDAFRQIVQKFGYYDLYLIDYDTGGIVYDFAKDRDWGTNLRYGPYSNSNLAMVVKKCMATDNPDDVFFSDFEPYEASMGEPTQYVAGPIFDGKKRLGIFAFQLSVATIDNVMNDNRGSARDGLGRTGEALIFGPLHRPRSDFRLYLENPERFLAEQKAQGVPDDVLNRIRTFKTTILQLPIDSPAADLALRGEQGTMIEVHPKGLESFLVSYMPLQVEGLHWAIIARMSTREAFEPIREMQWLFSGWGAGLLVFTVFAALLVARKILRPINALVGAAKKVAAGDLTAQVTWNSQDELGDLSDTFNSMTRSIREKTEVIEEKNRENEALLLNILPGEIAARLKGGEHEIADSFADVTVLFGDLVGFTALSSHTSPTEIVEMLNGLFSLFDQVAEDLGIEKIKTIGDCYMAVCGLPRPCADHADRMARMVLHMIDATREYGEKMGLPLQLRIGLNSGPVVAGVIGVTKFIYDLWGDTVNLASRMESTSVPGEIQVTRNVYEHLRDRYEFKSRGVVQVKGKGEIETWMLEGELRAAEVAQ